MPTTRIHNKRLVSLITTPNKHQSLFPPGGFQVQGSYYAVLLFVGPQLRLEKQGIFYIVDSVIALGVFKCQITLPFEFS